MTKQIVRLGEKLMDGNRNVIPHYDDNGFTGALDLSDERMFDLGNNKLTAFRTDPYGYWELKLARGRLPEELSGKFTSFELVKNAVHLYMNNKNRVIFKETD